MKSDVPSRTRSAARPKSAAVRTSRARFLDACAGRAVDHPPIWLMRQAGRALPEYRALKDKYSFLELVRTPELAAEVTLQPIRRFGFDAAIIFSDILVIPEAMGQAYRFRDTGGVEMDFLLRNAADVDRLELEAIEERLIYVEHALKIVRRELADRTALIGFAGAPWTLANYMIEGGGTSDPSLARALFYTDPVLFNRLLDKLTRAIVAYLKLQIAAGVDAIQIFDSLGGSIPGPLFEAMSGRWIQKIVSALRGRVPVIVFARGVHENWKAILGTGADVLGVDWTVDLAAVSKQLPARVAVQGNLDPAVLTTTPSRVAAETKRLLASMRGRRGHIFNLGHGVTPTARLECIERLVTTVRNSK